MDNINTNPDFVGIGEEKSGSSWIFYSLKEHPEICVSSIKEINFFSELYIYRKGIEYYRSFFKQCSPEMIKGEFTPHYLSNPKAAALIHKHFPKIKILACIRNPIERAYSSYKYNLEMKGPLSIHKTFEDAIKRNKDLIERGFYFKHLKRYYDLFPEKNILVLLYDNLRKDPINFIQKIYKFLNVNQVDFISPRWAEKRNISGSRIVKNKIPIINNILYYYIAKTGGRTRRFRNTNWLERIIDKLNIKEFIHKFILYNRKVEKKERRVIKKFPPLTNETRSFLLKIYQDDIKNLGILLKRDLSFWK